MLVCAKNVASFLT